MLFTLDILFRKMKMGRQIKFNLRGASEILRRGADRVKKIINKL